MTYKDWTPAERRAVGYAFQAWAENQYDDMRAGGGQDPDDVDRWNDLAEQVGNIEKPLPELFTDDVEAVENSVWNILDESGLLPGEAWWSDEVDPDVLRQAMRVAGWATNWGTPEND